MRGPDFRFGAHETRAEQPPDSWPSLTHGDRVFMGGCARVSRCSLQRRPRRDGEEAHLGPNACRHLSWDPTGSMSSPLCGELRKSPRRLCGARARRARRMASKRAHSRSSSRPARFPSSAPMDRKLTKPQSDEWRPGRCGRAGRFRIRR